VRGTLLTIGVTRTTAAAFFQRLQGAGVRAVVDVRAKTCSPRVATAGWRVVQL